MGFPRVSSFGQHESNPWAIILYSQRAVSDSTYILTMKRLLSTTKVLEARMASRVSLNTRNITVQTRMNLSQLKFTLLPTLTKHKHTGQCAYTSDGLRERGTGIISTDFGSPWRLSICQGGSFGKGRCQTSSGVILIFPFSGLSFTNFRAAKG